MENLKLCNQKNFLYKFANNNRKSYSPKILLLYIILALIFFYILLTLYYLINHITKVDIFFHYSKNWFFKKNNGLNETNKNNNISHNNFFTFNNDNLSEFTIFSKDKYINEQENFCQNPQILEKYEERIKLVPAKFLNTQFNMYVYKNSDCVSNYISKYGSWESRESTNIINALNYYSKKLNLSNNDIYAIDIGANIGWYTFLLNIFNFNIISFEPSKLNFYILKKNYCLNEMNSRKNIILINKGAYDKDIKCILYSNIHNDGNGMIKCEENNSVPISFIKTGEIELTILSHYIKYLEKLNVAFIKIDVEGSEGKALEGGIELLTRLHVPFIFIEFTPSALKIHNTDPKILLQKFLEYGYKINIHNFLDRNYNTPDEIMKLCKTQMNLYIVYERILE